MEKGRSEEQLGAALPVVMERLVVCGRFFDQSSSPRIHKSLTSYLIWSNCPNGDASLDFREEEKTKKFYLCTATCAKSTVWRQGGNVAFFSRGVLVRGNAPIFSAYPQQQAIQYSFVKNDIPSADDIVGAAPHRTTPGAATVYSTTLYCAF